MWEGSFITPRVSELRSIAAHTLDSQPIYFLSLCTLELKIQAKQWRTQWQRIRKREQEGLDQIARMKVEHSREIAVFQAQVETLKNRLVLHPAKNDVSVK